MSKITARVSDDQREGLRSLARETRLSMADLTRIAIGKLLEDRGAVTLPRVERDQSQAA